MVETAALKRSGIVLSGVIVAAALVLVLYGIVPLFTGVGAIEVTLGGLVFIGLSAAVKRVASAAVPDYEVAEVEVDDVITRDGDSGGPVPLSGGGVSANEIVDQIKRADDDTAVEALIVTLNTPGGAVVPSEDIRKATADFDGPTVAYAEDMAASGGYWIASGADEFHAREAAIVGSIGVVGSQLGRTELAEKVGLEYRRFVAGDYKDTPTEWRELSDDEVAYFQGLLDDWYDQFVETVAAGRGLDEQFIRDTEARIYPGEAAVENGLVDYCGPREQLEERLADRLGVDEITVEEFEPDRDLPEKLSIGAQKTARAFGAGVASVLVGDETPSIRAR
jgi:protease-4